MCHLMSTNLRGGLARQSVGNVKPTYVVVPETYMGATDVKNTHRCMDEARCSADFGDRAASGKQLHDRYGNAVYGCHDLHSGVAAQFNDSVAAFVDSRVPAWAPSALP